MVEVLKKVDDSAYKEIVCNRCGALLRYAPSDVIVDSYTVDYGGYREYRSYIRCPNDITSPVNDYLSDLKLCDNKVEVDG